MKDLWAKTPEFNEYENKLRKDYARKITKSLIKRVSDPKDLALMERAAEDLGFEVLTQFAREAKKIQRTTLNSESVIGSTMVMMKHMAGSQLNR